jgi:hypothetical protein
MFEHEVYPPRVLRAEEGLFWLDPSFVAAQRKLGFQSLVSAGVSAVCHVDGRGMIRHLSENIVLEVLGLL